MTRIDVSDITVEESISLTDAMEVIDKAGSGIVFVTDTEGSLQGTATDGDIRRAIIRGHDLNTNVEAVMNESPITIQDTWSAEDVQRQISTDRVRNKVSEQETITVPVVDEEGDVTDLAYIDTDGTLTREVKDTNGNIETVLVIGGAGYIGSILSRKLLNQGYEVRVLDNMLYGTHGIADLNDHDRFSSIEGDMRSIETVVNAIKGVDAVVHLGALVGDPASSIDSQKTLELNYHSVKLAAEICKYHQINRFIFASTCSVYGLPDDPSQHLTEESPLNPVSLYAQSKIESEKALLDIADRNFSPTILRMATIYGLSPRMRFDLVVNILTAKAYHEGTIPIFGGSQFRPNLHVADAAQAYIDCLEAPIEKVSGEIFNVGSREQNYRISKIGEIVSDVFPDAEIDVHEEKEDDRSYQVEFSKIEDTIGYGVEHTIEDGVREIKTALEDGQFEDYTASRYNNYKTLEEKSELFE